MKKKYLIDEIMNSLDGIKPAKAPDFFSTRLMAKFKADDHQPNMIGIHVLLRPIPVLTLFICLVVANVLVLNRSFTEQNTKQEAVQTDINSFAAEYNLNNTSGYADQN